MYLLCRTRRASTPGDAAYNNLDYKPVSVMMPVPKKDDNPYWGWFKKGTH